MRRKPGRQQVARVMSIPASARLPRAVTCPRFGFDRAPPLGLRAAYQTLDVTRDYIDDEETY